MKKGILSILAAAIFCSGIFASPSKVIMLRENGPLRVEEGSNGVKWSKTVNAGTELDLVSDKIIKKNLVTTDKTYPDVDFYTVKYKDEKYYVQVSEVAVADSPAVICEDAVLFTRPNLATFRNALLEAGTIVAVGKKVNSCGIDFAEVSFFDSNDGIKRTRYVEYGKLSESDKDVKAILMVQTALQIKDKDLMNETLNNARRINTSEQVSYYIEDLIAEKLGLSSFSLDEIEHLQEPFSAFISTKDGAKVNVRDNPGTKGIVTGQFESVSEPEVFVAMKTTRKETIEGITDYWYWVSDVDSAESDGEDGLSGWVFGGYLKK